MNEGDEVVPACQNEDKLKGYLPASVHYSLEHAQPWTCDECALGYVYHFIQIVCVSKCILSRANLKVRMLCLTMMWRQALLYLLHAAHARREPTSLDQVGPLCRCRGGEERGRPSNDYCLLVVAVTARLGHDGMKKQVVLCF
jgi:hypothetical protein